MIKESYGLCEGKDRDLYICKKIIIDDELGCRALIEIDILHRLKYPYIAKVEALTITDKIITLLFPFAEKTLRDITEDKYLPSAQKLPILHKICLALDHLHQHNILYLNIKDSNIIIKDNNPLLIDFSRSIMVDDIAEGKRFSEKHGNFYAPELLVGNIHNEKTEIWALGMLMVSVLIGGSFYVKGKQYQFFHEDQKKNIDHQAFVIEVIPNNLSILLQHISHCELCVKLLSKIFGIDPDYRPSAFNIKQDELFNAYLIEKENVEKESDKEIKEQKEIRLAPDSRNALKLLIKWIMTLYQECDIKLLFLATDLFNKANCFFADRSADERMHLAITSMWVAAKIISQNEIKLDHYITTIADVLPHVTAKQIIDMEIEIIQLLEGNLAQSELYNICNTIDQLAVAFEDIIMNKDSTVYCSTNLSEWIASVKNTIPDDGNGKQILIKNFFG